MNILFLILFLVLEEYVALTFGSLLRAMSPFWIAFVIDKLKEINTDIKIKNILKLFSISFAINCLVYAIFWFNLVSDIKGFPIIIYIIILCILGFFQTSG